MVQNKEDTRHTAKDAIVVWADRIMNLSHHSEKAIVNCVEETAHKDKDGTKSVFCLLLCVFSIRLYEDSYTNDANGETNYFSLGNRLTQE